ncbi:molybdopterin-dependent oxidoreductase [Haloferax sp. MBLA0076]|uniref:Molybdopterin-dependent oxidoreductase n=1 Tax=Haloferax litoreum TaxID=2666140 RepID=A0A6A8GMQ1_9EURY|nr:MULTISPECIES: molybdopterin-dependent oxidoreductase [Haloferax]KAB1190595.1 molybdopterin-dependent oxidoreductase [Haloferax sp. CBA1148]MRX23587.1 molybdopterin-dependent oxidoreductase [Haloferax litoreum]
MTTPVLVRGREKAELDQEEISELPHVTRDVAVTCASGPQHESTWVGVPLESIVEVAGSPSETTHLAVTSADDCHVYVAIGDAMSGLLAVERDGEALENPRLVVPGIGGMRTVKDVVEIEAVSLSPDTDPQQLERHPKIDESKR